MSSYVSADLRRLVTSRAQSLCEYCLIHEDDTYLGCQVDHVISEKHGGPTELENPAERASPDLHLQGRNLRPQPADGLLTDLCIAETEGLQILQGAEMS